MRTLLALAVVAVLALATGTARAASPDSEAPANAPAHWLPPEPWVYNHWLPYDERRLYRLLRTTRSEIWLQLRDDRRTLAQVARRRGWRSARLADALVRPWRGRVSRGRLRVLRDRAERTITQGHLAQHILFHSLHQFAIPSEAPRIFGVSDFRFRDLRRAELSPLAIGALSGRSPAQIEALSLAVLAERARAGVSGVATPAAQARLLLARQASQLPRWLGQARYNGPPKTHDGKLVATPRDYATNPAVSADGQSVVYEGYRQKLPLAVTLGEIAVYARTLGGTRPPLLVSPPLAAGPRGARPTSNYNGSVSGDGALVAYEQSAGNNNFAKRYGRIEVVVADTRTRRRFRLSRPRVGDDDSQSAFNPVVSADGSRVLMQAADARGRTHVWSVDPRTPARPALVSTGLPASSRGGFTDVFQPSASRNGSVVAFTLARGRVGAARGATSEVWVREAGSAAARALTAAGGALRFAFSPSVSPDGGHVAFVGVGGGSARPRVFVRDLRSGAVVAVSDPAEGVPLDPQLAEGGQRVVYTGVRGARSVVLAREVGGGGAPVVVSRASGAAGPTANGWSRDPSISADGRVVAFVSEATNLVPGKSDNTPAVYARDLAAATTTLVSTSTKGAAAPAPAAPHHHAPAPASLPAPSDGSILVEDNAFRRGKSTAPVIHLRRGGRLTWRWASQESHNVTVRSGPRRFRSTTRTRGTFTARFTRAGTYRIVCTLHSPGMRMTVVAR